MILRLFSLALFGMGFVLIVFSLIGVFQGVTDPEYPEDWLTWLSLVGGVFLGIYLIRLAIGSWFG